MEAYRRSGAAEGAAFFALDGDTYAISASYGIPRPAQSFRLPSANPPVLVEGLSASRVIPVCLPEAFVALFGPHDHKDSLVDLIAAKGASWSFYNGERMEPRLCPQLDPGAFPGEIQSELANRGLTGIALASLDLSPLLAYIAENRPSAHTDRVLCDFFRLLARATRETGKVFRAPCGRALIAHFSRHPADPELIGEQMHKVLRRAIGAPAVLDSVYESTLSLDMGDPGALGVLEAFAAGL